MTDIQARIAKAVDNYSYRANQGKWLTIGGTFGEHGEKHAGGTHVEVAPDGKILAGPAAFASKNISNLSQKHSRDDGHPVPPKNEGEDDKKWLKRIAPQLPPPAKLPEDHAAYFNMDKAHAVVPMSQLRSTKSDEENQKGGNNAPKFMDLSRRGFTGKRDPITVRKNDQGGYDVVDGNGTFTGAKAHNWKEMPVQIEGHQTESPMHPGEGQPPIPDDTKKEIPHGKPFFTPEEMGLDKIGERQPIAPNAGYAAIHEIGKVADRQLFGVLNNIGKKLGYEVYDFGSITPKEMDDKLEKPGGFVTMGPVKAEERSTEKVNDPTEYNGDWSRLIDIARATVAVDSIADAHNVLSSLREQGVKFSRKPKDRLSKTVDDTHYRDIMTNIKMPNGCIVELQINMKPMLKAKKYGGHQNYDVMRKIQGDLDAEKREPTYDEELRLKRAIKNSQIIYDKAYEEMEKGEAAKTKYSRRLHSAIEQYAKKKMDAPGQRDLFTGEVRKTPKTQKPLRWITLKSHDGNGTSHVQIDGSGNIHAGPSALAGKNLFGNHPAKEAEKPRIEKVAARPAIHHDGPHKPQMKRGKHPLPATASASEVEYTKDGRPVGEAILSTSDIETNPEKFQYKISGINKETGTTNELKDSSKFNNDFGGRLLVWQDPDDGKVYCINGHHRLEIAKRSPHSTEIGGYKGRLPVRFVDAKTHIEARAIGALSNIAEKNGTATDAAKFMRDMGVGLEEFKKHGISPKGSVALAALELKKLSPTLFQKLTNGTINETRAQTIASSIPDEEMQDQFYHWLQKKEEEPGKFSERKVAEMARSTAKLKPKASSGKGGMFDDFFKDFPIEQRADLVDSISRTLSGELKSLKDVSSEKRAALIEESGENNLDIAANRERAQKTALMADEFDKRSYAQGHSIAVELDRLAQRIQDEPRKRASIIREGLKFVRKSLGQDERREADSGTVGESHVGLQKDVPGRDGQEQRVPDSATRMSRVEMAKTNYRYYLEKFAGKK